MKNIFLKLGIATVVILIAFFGFMFIKAKTYKVQNPVATIQFEGYDKAVKIELDPQSAPNAVANFIKLANSGFYTDYKMAISKNQIISDGSAEKAKLSQIKENPEEDYIYGIKADTLANGEKNYIKHEKGVITMLNESYGYYEELFDTGNNQFAILTDDVEGYNQVYAGFGHVVEGMDVLEAISASRVEESDSTEEEASEDNNIVKIKSVSVDTFGVDYGVPEVINYTELLNRLQ